MVGFEGGLDFRRILSAGKKHQIRKSHGIIMSGRDSPSYRFND